MTLKVENIYFLIVFIVIKSLLKMLTYLIEYKIHLCESEQS